MLRESSRAEPVLARQATWHKLMRKQQGQRMPFRRAQRPSRAALSDRAMNPATAGVEMRLERSGSVRRGPKPQGPHSLSGRNSPVYVLSH
ncbi:hypothetical protein AUEXF2481DRAFT_43765 [Aureobasidium subglaciale EXF-2481]|uniref:Uncharacterized protein n=1 Tax=Aureobasidium subglaciale (strain EXF-2481) TaxID=1043005 RepID=A0A074YY72_AURSE|nr:uncharacterized protein AUEXF2481DRAFT_43765 [Aureobasidium subglaciale EXF-2481]KEQ91821.1 hypothetical protein AUEXF2481DRAFT_43765 [Aureobasidium subglaciale EXF-2481]